MSPYMLQFELEKPSLTHEYRGALVKVLVLNPKALDYLKAVVGLTSNMLVNPDTDDILDLS